MAQNQLQINETKDINKSIESVIHHQGRLNSKTDAQSFYIAESKYENVSTYYGEKDSYNATNLKSIYQKRQEKFAKLTNMDGHATHLHSDIASIEKSIYARRIPSSEE